MIPRMGSTPIVDSSPTSVCHAPCGMTARTYHASDEAIERERQRQRGPSIRRPCTGIVPRTPGVNSCMRLRSPCSNGADARRPMHPRSDGTPRRGHGSDDMPDEPDRSADGRRHKPRHLGPVPLVAVLATLPASGVWSKLIIVVALTWGVPVIRDIIALVASVLAVRSLGRGRRLAATNYLKLVSDILDRMYR